jgi:hypothetical protein
MIPKEGAYRQTQNPDGIAPLYSAARTTAMITGTEALVGRRHT